MQKIFDKALNWIAKNFREDPSKMLIWTGVAGWSLSSLAQVGAILFNNKISNEKKSFLVPQELADAAINIGAFFLFTQMTKKVVSKLFSTGKLIPKQVKEHIETHKDMYDKNKIGKIDFNLDDMIKNDINFPKDTYNTWKEFGTTIATVGAGIVSSNIITPIVRNKMASNMQKNYINNKQAYEAQIVQTSANMKI